MAHACGRKLPEALSCPKAQEDGPANHAVGNDFQGIIAQSADFSCNDVIAAEYGRGAQCPDQTDIDENTPSYRSRISTPTKAEKIAAQPTGFIFSP